MSQILFPVMTEDSGAKGVIVTWFFEDGEPVEVGDLIAEIAMDKVDREIKAEAAGVLRVLVPEEEAVMQGTVIGRIE
ncbi:lipoyl domain-containing protein [Paeniglutamicibacter gangotriensis]|uniref:2-oxoglutarate dehydrogenase, E2 subunit, dihydrolipoamide succinyltransferase n=1 Tax=Paeniglutamicibacter gangotriensis Lz1y TaxID=1276920 RepID=M7NFU2_9MICC|nr:biotin/lipoyl-containing protein [Paeniglutamicibacter gangotriensis]EMQ97363.1 2-oxoglutarate dehydrogenase, E2 subunit, dihydrolipoamide succinyltransferase [Paeniglutamicibacter gangotriensis Lz1y]